MTSVNLIPALINALPVLFIAGVLFFAVGCGIYMLGFNAYNFLKPGDYYKAVRKYPENPHNLRIICFFFVFIGVLGIGLGTYSWLGQPRNFSQLAPAIASGLFFLGFAFVAYKKVRKL